jgi:hypothetical protein
MSKPLNPNAQSFCPVTKAVAITFAVSRRQPQPLLLPLLPLSEAWPPVPAFHDLPNDIHLPDWPCGPYGQVIYDAGAQPQPVYEAEMGFQKLKGPEVLESFGRGERVGREPGCRVQRPRLSNRKARVKCRGKVWIPKKDGVLPFPPVLEVMNKKFQMGNSSKKENGAPAPARIIHFPYTLDEVISSGKTTVMIKNIPNQFMWALSLSLSLSLSLYIYIYIYWINLLFVLR